MQFAIFHFTWLQTLTLRFTRILQLLGFCVPRPAPPGLCLWTPLGTSLSQTPWHCPLILGLIRSASWRRRRQGEQQWRPCVSLPSRPGSERVSYVSPPKTCVQPPGRSSHGFFERSLTFHVFLWFLALQTVDLLRCKPSWIPVSRPSTIDHAYY